MKKILSLSCLLVFFSFSYSQQVIFLYKDSIPNSKPAANLEKTTIDKDGVFIIRDISIPTLSIFLPAKKIANGTAVIICPGGGYWVTSIVKEGFAVAKEFNKWGVAAFIVKYRIPNDSSMIDRKIGPLQDAQRAIQLVRMHAK